MNRSFRPGTASQSNLQRSFGTKNAVGTFNSQRPGTAVVNNRNVEESSNMRATLPPPTTHNDVMGSGSGFDNLGKYDAMDFHPPGNNEMHFMDDDEDLRKQIQEMEGPKKEPLDPVTQRQVDDIMKYIQNLKYSSDLNKRVESLIALNDIIQGIQSH